MFGLVLIAAEFTGAVSGALYQGLRNFLLCILGLLDGEAVITAFLAHRDERGGRVPSWIVRTALWFWPSMANEIDHRLARRQAWEDKL